MCLRSLRPLHITHTHTHTHTQGLNKLSPPHKSSLKWAIERTDLRNRVTARLNVAAVKLEMAVSALSAGRNAGACVRVCVCVCLCACVCVCVSGKLKGTVCARRASICDWRVRRRGAA